MVPDYLVQASVLLDQLELLVRRRLVQLKPLLSQSHD